MNRTMYFPMIAFLSLIAAATQAYAGDDDRDGAPVPLSTMTRAEVRALPAPEPTERDGAPIAISTLPRSVVIADLEVWRNSGLAAAEQSEEADAFSPRYREALARYLAMRSSPAFAERVQHIARARGEKQLIATR